jgi:hypothetical protein
MDAPAPDFCMRALRTEGAGQQHLCIHRSQIRSACLRLGTGAGANGRWRVEPLQNTCRSRNGLDEEKSGLLRNAQTVVVTFENNWNVSLVINLSSVIQEEGSSVDSACAQLFHVPLIYSYADADGVLHINKKPKTVIMSAQKWIITWRGANFKQAT